MYDDEKVEVKEGRVILGGFLHLAQGGVPVEPNDHHVTHSPSFTVFSERFASPSSTGRPGRSGPSLVDSDPPINDRPIHVELGARWSGAIRLDRFDRRHHGCAPAGLTFWIIPSLCAATTLTS
jgi:hypothetical protein